MKKIILIQLLFLVNSYLSYSQCGVLDNTFGIGGKVSSVIFPPNIIKPYSVFIQPDQKIVAAGEARNVIQSGQAFSIVRYNTDGSIDASFGTNGVVIPNINPDTGYWLTDIDYQNSQNKIIVIGVANFNFIAAILRFS